MLTAFVEKILPKPHKIAGVELHIGSDGSRAYHVVLLEQKGTKVNIVNSAFGEHELSALCKSGVLNSHIPISLSISGRGVLIKKSPLQDSISNTIQREFPGIKPNEFFIQKNLLREGQLISVIRKELFDEISGAFAKENLSIICCGLGPFHVLPVLEINGATGIMQFPPHHFKLEDGNLLEYSYLSSEPPETEVSPFKFDKVKIDKRLIVAFSNAFSYLVAGSNESEQDEYFTERMQKKEEDFRHKIIFKRMGWAALLFSFVLLFTNFIWFNKASELNSELTSSLGYNSERLEKMKMLNLMVERRQQFLNSLGWENTGKVSFFADRLAASLPESISLTVLSIFPVGKTDRINPEHVLFQSNQIQVKGVSVNNIHFNEWVAKLKSFDWIQDVKIVGFKKQGEGKSDEFELQLELNRSRN